MSFWMLRCHVRCVLEYTAASRALLAADVAPERPISRELGDKAGERKSNRSRNMKGHGRGRHGVGSGKENASLVRVYLTSLNCYVYYLAMDEKGDRAMLEG